MFRVYTSAALEEEIRWGGGGEVYYLKRKGSLTLLAEVSTHCNGYLSTTKNAS